ncbi:MAG: hypothetical protein JRF60_15445 [Deltaproteobacteria bacterium]|nr:hypothetical protein [Deltaproteobacteria bacterium]
MPEKKLKYVIDTSNEDTKFLRNKVRSELIPLIKESYNPRIIETVNRLSSIIRSDEEWIEDIITPFYEDILLYSKEKEIALSISKLIQIHMAPKRRVIRKAIENLKGDLRSITFSHIASIIKLLERVPAFGSLDLPGSITVTRKEDTLYISSGEKVRSKTGSDLENIKRSLFEYTINKPDLEPKSLCIKETGSRLRFSVINAKCWTTGGFF